ncbi:LPS export ABC transporter permease LptG [Candidatus Pantoea carbekii]|uniref:Uncharacterized protein n=1 Tax=Candidatus Pantoea carbekii TaxID=1235990 RepID=U3U821_9GAMM|nr:LPS export ABC transporter permease LptG [Candidatus Pantoea carbekii]AKC31969.1 inner membrane protein YjgQ [Candidatus Pantoea carbekii]BAO00489.1 hypothetical protein HHS_05190 [Candidatus Pantoea carbekii]
MFKILDRYIGKKVFNIIMIALFILLSLSAIIKFIEQLRQTWQGNYTALGAAYYTILTVPKDIEIFFSMAVLLGGIIGLGILAQHNELVVMQAIGFTHARIVLAVIKITVPLVISMMLLSECVVDNCERIARNYRTEQLYGGPFFSKNNKLWIRDGNSFIYINHIKDNTNIVNINIYTFDAQFHLTKWLYAEQGTWNETRGAWMLEQIDELHFKNFLQQVIKSHILIREWNTNLTPDKLSVLVLDPYSLSINGLYKYSKYLENSGQESGRYVLNMWRKIFLPFSIVSMLLTALSCIMGPLLNVSMTTRVVTGISFGFLFYVLDQIFSPLTLIFGMSSVIGAIFPSVVFFTLSLFLFIKYH